MEKLNVDCLILIFNELKAEIRNKYLYSCLLVNKEWSHLVVPILWANPEYLNNDSKKKFCNTIVSCLPPSLKQLLFDNDIRLPSTIFSKSLTFNYISFFKYLHAKVINNIIEFVFEKEITKSIDFLEKRKFLEQEIYKLLISQCKNVRYLDWNTSLPLQSFPGAQTCFSQLCSIDVNLKHVNSNNLYELAQICRDIKMLSINNYSQDIPGLISLIDAQRDLQGVTFSSHNMKKKGNFKELGRAIARKSCTIKHLTLYNSIGVISHSFLTSLINLTYLMVSNNGGIYDETKEIVEFKKYLENSNFPNLCSLEMGNNLSCFKELAILIEKTKGEIEDVQVFCNFADNTGILVQAISNRCPNIQFLSTYIGINDLIYVETLLKNCKGLVRLYLDNADEINDIGDKLLGILAKFSPESLTNIGISGNWKYTIDAFTNFLESYRGRKLTSFDINGYYGEPMVAITTEHINVIRKYYNEEIVESSNILDSYSY
ncbi:uncharacterized protein OCT59_000412 [Rhizophagus irregularis]|uniref:RNI-like protein n=5 Tax=Rhizophagus irregularis TaxID=588596 RepID=A0A2N1MLL2_9GLOM|nr:hypothetical protein RirG_184820 [Rhizophagus irregularis DAOM 197198w]PKK62516.1 hypothetical protein RhiirC2_172320 [Rhizophagus irregularis]UZN99132.1 hypothetical protein OCT59_000412 [Rhizophagus irregularis]CAB5350013.1 unnamed protein product [Rhizophagus irregularis]CAB5359048.1 unnamed protein product [Rhizophagus irregularis]